MHYLVQWRMQVAARLLSDGGQKIAAAVIAAENGATEAQLKAIFGWENLAMAARYTKKARQDKIAAAAMHLILPADPQCEGSSNETRRANIR